MGPLAGFITLLASILGIWAYLREEATREQNRDYFRRLFESTAKKNQEVLRRLRQYAEDRNAWSEPMGQGYSLRDMVDVLETAERDLFTDEHLRGVGNMSASGKNFDDLVSRLKRHNRFLQIVEHALDRVE